MDAASGPDDDTTKSPSPPNVVSKSTDISQSETKLTDPRSHQTTSGQSLQGRPSHATIARKTPSHEPLDSAANASSRAASSRPSRIGEARPADSRATTVPAVASGDLQATAQRRNIRGIGVGLGAGSWTGQPPTDADNTLNVVANFASKEVEAAQRESVTSPAPTSSTSSTRQTTHPHPLPIPPPSRDAPPSQTMRGSGRSIPLGHSEPGDRRERDESSLHRVESSRERNETKFRAQQVDRTTSIQPSTKPFTSPPPLNRPSASLSPLPSLPAPALTKTASSRVRTIRGIRTEESQARSGGALPELPHHRDEERGRAPDEQSRMNPSATLHKLALPPSNHAAAATEPPSQSQSVSAPRRLDKSDSRFKGSEGAHHEGKRATEGPTSAWTSDTKGRKGPAVPEEYETQPEDSVTSSDGGKRRKAEPNPTTGFPPNVIQTIAPTKSSVERTYSSHPSRGNDSGAPRLPEMGDSRGKVGQSSPAPSLDTKETSFRPPPVALVSTQNRTKPVIRVSSTSGSTVSSVESRPPRPRPPSVCDSEIPVTPSDLTPTTVETPFNPKEGHGSQVQPGFLSKTDPPLHENKALAPLDEQHHYERLEKSFPGRLPIPSGRTTNEIASPSHLSVYSQRGITSPNHLQVHSGGIMKQISSSNINPAKLQQGGLNRRVAENRISSNPSTSTSGEGGDEPITTQPAPPELDHPPVFQRYDVPTQPDLSGDGLWGEGPQAEGGSRPSGRGGSPGKSRSPRGGREESTGLSPGRVGKNTGEGRDGPIATQPASLELKHPLAVGNQQGAVLKQLSPSDGGSREEGLRGSSGGGRPPGKGHAGGEPPGQGGPPDRPGEGRTPRGNRPLEQPGRRSPQEWGNPPGPTSGGEDTKASTSCWPCCK